MEFLANIASKLRSEKPVETIDKWVAARVRDELLCDFSSARRGEIEQELRSSLAIELRSEIEPQIREEISKELVLAISNGVIGKR